VGNSWDDGYPSGGNYWSSYSGHDLFRGPYQNVSGSDGIGDVARIINTGNRDNYPLMKTYPWASHDIGFTGASVSKNVVAEKHNVSARVSLFNYGSYPENCRLKLYANQTVIGELDNVALPSKDSIIVPFGWNTTGFARGNYTISVAADPVPGATDTSDNTLIVGWVFVSIAGDVNGDRKVDLKDVYAVGKAFGAVTGDSRYNPNLDINDDGKIDLKDYFTTCKNYGKSW
jgi:hypothetical protein